jgi:hypothetical protein
MRAAECRQAAAPEPEPIATLSLANLSASTKRQVPPEPPPSALVRAEDGCVITYPRALIV